MEFTIQDFWKERVATSAGGSVKQLPGWHTSIDRLETFVEAPLVQSNQFQANTTPFETSLILVSAPGAVGKSTLARQISAETGATYVDLAEAEPVGGNFLSGGLAKSGLFPEWEQGRTALLIDGLDEARLKVTQEAFEAFLSDVAEISKQRTMPTVLFGRTGAIEEAWLHLDERSPVIVLELGYYNEETAMNFAVSQLQAHGPREQHQAKTEEAVSLLLRRLREDTESDGGRFAGYAPVLQAVAKHVACENNPGALVSKIEKGEKPVTLQSVVADILEREHKKLSQLTFDDPDLATRLYLPEEQLARLAAHVFQLAPPEVPEMSPKDAEIYANALATWVPEHPFLGGSLNSAAREETASTVFGAVISATALKNRNTSDAALQRELSKGAAANPFLAEFYLENLAKGVLQPEHVGVVYSSIRSQLSLGDSASLLIEGVEEGSEDDLLKAEVEISVSRQSEERPKVLQFASEQTGAIHLGNHIEDVEIYAPYAQVDLGGVKETVLVAPVSIQCEKLQFSTPRLVVETQPGKAEGAVYLEASKANAISVASPPTLNGNVTLSVVWDGANAFPWTSHASSPRQVQDPRLKEALRRFRKLIISFRSHSKGSLKRYAAKIEHERMTKGTGRAVLAHLVKAGVLATDGTMYTLYPDKLAEVASISYGQCMACDYPEQTVSFIEEALQGA